MCNTPILGVFMSDVNQTILPSLFWNSLYNVQCACMCDSYLPLNILKLVFKFYLRKSNVKSVQNLKISRNVYNDTLNMHTSTTI